MTDLSQPVLEFCDATIAPGSKDQSPVAGANFALRAGGLLLLRVDPMRAHLPIGDAAEGLVKPESGRVRFLGEDWGAMSAARGAQMRSRARRVFDGSGWVSNLDVSENVTLAERHWTRRSLDEVRGEAARLARACGLAAVPDGRPAWVAQTDLRRCEWVRAFMGQPALVILELPTEGLPTEYADRLIEVAREARGRGAAVLWTTTSAEIWSHPGLAEAERHEMRGERMVRLEPACAVPPPAGAVSGKA